MKEFCVSVSKTSKVQAEDEVGSVKRSSQVRSGRTVTHLLVYRASERSNHGKERTMKSAVMTNKTRKRQEKRTDILVAVVSVIVFNLFRNNKRGKVK